MPKVVIYQRRGRLRPQIKDIGAHLLGPQRFPKRALSTVILSSQLRYNTLPGKRLGSRLSSC